MVINGEDLSVKKSNEDDQGKKLIRIPQMLGTIGNAKMMNTKKKKN